MDSVITVTLVGRVREALNVCVTSPKQWAEYQVRMLFDFWN
jgi:hypothetical protein